MKKKTKTAEQITTHVYGRLPHAPRTTDLDKLKHIIKNQSPGTVISGEWDRLEAIEHVALNGETDVKISVAQITFCFSKGGRLKGIANWKQ